MSTQSSEYFTEDLDNADAVFVDDYCYTVAWTAQAQSEEAYKDGFDPQAELVEGYRRLLEQPRHVAHGIRCALACLEDQEQGPTVAQMHQVPGRQQQRARYILSFAIMEHREPAQSGMRGLLAVCARRAVSALGCAEACSDVCIP